MDGIKGHPYRSQCGQDEYIDIAYQGRRNGVFFEAGAGDGDALSNTWFFEKHRGWTGVCVEPNIESLAMLRANRSCHIFGDAIGADRRDDVGFWEVTGGTRLCSALDEACDHNRLDSFIKQYGGQKSLVPVRVFTTQQVLDKFGIVRIDYMSLDTDGNELDVLRGIDWSRTFVGMLTIENIGNDRGIREFMADRGYNHVSHLMWDDVFAHESLT